MTKHLYEHWCDCQATDVASGCRLHLLREKHGARVQVHTDIVSTVLSHYEDPARLAARTARLGFTKASKILENMLPKTKQARSGHLGEILATEVVPAVLPGFQVPIKRLRWLDGRESALRGEDVIGLAIEKGRVRFLKGESKSRASLTPKVVAEARAALKANYGLPSQHAMAFVMHRLFDEGNHALAVLFERYLLEKTIALEDMVHLLFTLSGNDGSGSLQADLKAVTGKIEQHAVNLRITDHQQFVASIYKP